MSTPTIRETDGEPTGKQRQQRLSTTHTREFCPFWRSRRNSNSYLIFVSSEDGRHTGISRADSQFLGTHVKPARH